MKTQLKRFVVVSRQLDSDGFSPLHHGEIETDVLALDAQEAEEIWRDMAMDDEHLIAIEID